MLRYSAVQSLLQNVAVLLLRHSSFSPRWCFRWSAAHRFFPNCDFATVHCFLSKNIQRLHQIIGIHAIRPNSVTPMLLQACALVTEPCTLSFKMVFPLQLVFLEFGRIIRQQVTCQRRSSQCQCYHLPYLPLIVDVFMASIQKQVGGKA